MKNIKRFFKHFSSPIVFIILILFFAVSFIYYWDKISSDKSPYSKDYDLDFYYHNRNDIRLYPFIFLDFNLKT